MNYRVLIVDVEIRLLFAMSLKDKRQVRVRLIERLKNQYNISVAEVDNQDKWQRLNLAIAYVALNQTAAEEMSEKLRSQMDSLIAAEAEIIIWNADII